MVRVELESRDRQMEGQRAVRTRLGSGTVRELSARGRWELDGRHDAAWKVRSVQKDSDFKFGAGFGLLDGAKKVRQCVELRATFFCVFFWERVVVTGRKTESWTRDKNRGGRREFAPGKKIAQWFVWVDEWFALWFGEEP